MVELETWIKKAIEEHVSGVKEEYVIWDQETFLEWCHQGFSVNPWSMWVHGFLLSNKEKGMVKKFVDYAQMRAAPT